MRITNAAKLPRILEDQRPLLLLEHEVIVRAVESGDALGAHAVVDTNWRNAAARLSSVIGAHGERGSW